MHHDPVKLKTKSKHAHGRKYLLKRSSAGQPKEKVEAPAVPTSVDLRLKPYMPAVLDQGQLGSCASNAMANDLCFLMGKEGRGVFHPSRLALYYNCRVSIEGSPAGEDTGVAIDDMCKAVLQFHACPESDWPYDIDKFSQPPPEAAVLDEQLHKQFKYVGVADQDSMKACLARGFPVLVGIEVFPSFESDAVAETGIVPNPASSEQSLGGHALAIYGYDDEKQAVLVMNSWSERWGLGGFCWIPYSYPDLWKDLWCPRYFL